MPETVGPVLNAPEVPAHETGTPGKPSGKWSMPKPLEKMNSEERQEWLRGNGESKSWSESSLSRFETPDAPVDEPKDAKSDEVEKSVEGDVTTVSKGERSHEAGEGIEDSSSKPAEGTSEWAQHHDKAVKALPARLIKELSSEMGEIQAASNNLRISSGLSEFFVHVLADVTNPTAVLKQIIHNQALVSALENQRPEVVIDVLRDLDKKAGPRQQSEQVKVTKAPPPAREVGGRGSSAGDDEKRAIAEGDFRAFRRAANSKAAARSR